MKSVTAAYCWNDKLLTTALCWQYSIKISKQTGVELSAVMTPTLGGCSCFVSGSRPSPTSHLPFPGYTADKSSNTTWMWPDRLDCNMSPAGYDLESLNRRAPQIRPVHIMSFTPDTVSQRRNPAGVWNWQTYVLLSFLPPLHCLSMVFS